MSPLDLDTAKRIIQEAPACTQCNAITIRSGDTAKCLNCGHERNWYVALQQRIADVFADIRKHAEQDALARLAVPEGQHPRTRDGMPILMSGNYWYRVGGSDTIVGCGVLCITDADSMHGEDYEPGQRWTITVRNEDGETYDLSDIELYSSAQAASDGGENTNA